MWTCLLKSLPFRFDGGSISCQLRDFAHPVGVVRIPRRTQMQHKWMVKHVFIDWNKRKMVVQVR